MFLETNWGTTQNVKKSYLDNDGRSIDHFITIDSEEFKHVMGFDKDEPTLRVFAKVSRAIAKRHLATPKNINLIRWFTPTIIGA